MKIGFPYSAFERDRCGWPAGGESYGSRYRAMALLDEEDC